MSAELQAPAPPRASPRDEILSGAAAVLHAARLVLRDPGLRAAAAWPTALTAAGCLVVAAWAGWLTGEEESGFHAFVVALVAISSMPPTILFRSWARLGLEARRAYGAAPGETALTCAPFFATFGRESWKALRQAVVVAVGLAPLLLATEILPLVGDVLTVALAGAWAWYWIVLDALEIPVEVAPGPRVDPGPPWFERGLRAAGARSRLLFLARWTGALTGWLARPWRLEARFTERRRWETLGFALAAGGLLAIPVLGLLFRAVAITAATGLVARDE